MTEGSEIVRIAEELAAKAAALHARAEAGMSEEQADELRAELAQLEEQLAALEAEERALDLEFADAADEDDDDFGERGAPLGREVSDLVDTVVDTVTSRIGDLAGSLARDLTGSKTTDVIERVIDVDGPIPVSIRNQAGSIRILPSMTNEVRVLAERAAPGAQQIEEINVDVERDGESVKIRTHWSGGWRKRVKLTVEVPVGSRVDGSTKGGSIRLDGTRGPALLRTSGGSIRAIAAAGEVDVETAGGSIRVLDHEGGGVRARTSGGSIRIAGRIEGTVDASTSGGSIRVFDLVGAEVRARTSGGSIKVTGLLEGDSSLDTSGGSITVSLPVESNLRIDGKGSSVHNDFSELHTKSNRVEGVLGTGDDGSLHVRTSGGSLNLRRS